MSEGYRTLSIEQRQGAEWLTLDRPESLNAMNGEMIDELLRYFTGLEYRSEVRVVVLRGAGRGFCAGLDLNDMAGVEDPGSADEALPLQRRLSRLILAMRRCPPPIVCLLHGAASGGGFALALASDIRIASSDARMNAAFIKVGLTGCDVGVSYHLPRIVGGALAAELLMTGRFLDAERALAHGVVSEVVEPQALHGAGETLVGELLQAAPKALQLTKEALDANVAAPSLESAVALEDRQQALCLTSGEFARRVAAFRKRGTS